MPPKKKKSTSKKKTHGQKWKAKKKRKQKRKNSGNKSEKKKSKKIIMSYIDLSKGSDDSPSIIAELRQYANVGKQEYPQNPSLRVVTDEDIFKDLSPINPDIMTPPMQRSITSNNQNSNFNKKLSFKDDDDDDDVNMTRNDSSPQFKVVDESWTRTFGGKRKKTRKRTKRRRKKRKTKKRRK